ncbi:hypothetical protein DGWBC_1527 [Dehalogenimonas sp. WBC-2]|nr:hypothetical protein DGWBC_1527 [Dehalogenimonas sp. WBC-2]
MVGVLVIFIHPTFFELIDYQFSIIMKGNKGLHREFRQAIHRKVDKVLYQFAVGVNVENNETTTRGEAVSAFDNTLIHLHLNPILRSSEEFNLGFIAVWINSLLTVD